MNLERYFANMLASITEINIKLDKNRIKKDFNVSTRCFDKHKYKS